jgi:hypothetical protein
MNHNHAKPTAKITITIKMASSIIGAVLPYCSPTKIAVPRLKGFSVMYYQLNRA